MLAHARLLQCSLEVPLTGFRVRGAPPPPHPRPCRGGQLALLPPGCFLHSSLKLQAGSVLVLRTSLGPCPAGMVLPVGYN